MLGFRKMVFLMRHGDALSGMEDSERPLSAPGRTAAEEMAAWAAGCGIMPTKILHSTKLRARETAQIFAARFQLPDALQEASGLCPDDPVQPWVEELLAARHNLLLVGHLPFMGRLASCLLTGSPARASLFFATASFAAFGYDGLWHLAALLPPECLGECCRAGTTD